MKSFLEILLETAYGTGNWNRSVWTVYTDTKLNKKRKFERSLKEFQDMYDTLLKNKFDPEKRLYMIETDSGPTKMTIDQIAKEYTRVTGKELQRKEEDESLWDKFSKVFH
jgi:hypothetical protein